MIWFLLGDTHAMIKSIFALYKSLKKIFNTNCTGLKEMDIHVIILGDVGTNYYGNEADRKFKNEMANLPFTYVCLRGNHESRVKDVADKYPDAWEIKQLYGGEVYVEKDYPTIHYLSDVPAVYVFDGIKTLSIPGAYSVDKDYRIYNGWRWYANEQLTEEEMQLGRDLISQEGSFDLVISHTCPLEYEPRDLFMASIDQSSVDKTMEIYLGEIEYRLDYKRWAWGHYHVNRLYPWDNGKQKLMIGCEDAVDLHKFMDMTRSMSLDEILIKANN